MTLPVAIDLDPRYHGRLVEVETPKSMPEYWQGTPVEKLILAQNFKKPIDAAGKPELLIVTCIEFRYALPVPSMYSYVIRRASGRLIGSEFSLAYVLSKGVEHVVMIGHNDCGMTKVPEAAPAMIDALVREGWHRDRAEEFIKYQAGRYTMDDELTALEREYVRLRRLFKRVHLAPLFVCLADQKLYIPKWFHDRMTGARAVEDETRGATVADEELLTLM
ncbi:MAG TPA: hypothetical protein V6D08_04390 [Candidatus Obscuribacterales bacterium]